MRITSLIVAVALCCCWVGAESWSFLGAAWKSKNAAGGGLNLPTTPSSSSLSAASSTTELATEESSPPASSSNSRIPTIADEQTTTTRKSENAVLVDTTHAETTTRILADAADFVQPERDRRQYRVIVLPNNLRVLLVSDQTKKVGVEAAAVHVQAGHFDDTLPGLAHFHEHMLFLGTAKYPTEDEYEGFLSQFGGYSNAYTDMEDTNYYFAVTTASAADDNNSTTTAALAGALDRFSQFFIRPTFDRDAVDRELRAIDSEYRNSKTSDAWRSYQLLKSVSNQQHPFGKFGCGNYETLSSSGQDHLLAELENFWKTYYQTYNLRLVVAGHAGLDALQDTVEQTFGQLPYSQGAPRHVKTNPNNQIFTREHAVYGTAAFGADQLGVVRKVLPHQEMRTIKLYFATPPLDDPAMRPSKPVRVVSHLLGHESPGSLHALLNEEGYLQALSSGVGIDTSDFSLFALTLSLTPLGMQEYQKVLDLVFQWIAVIRDNLHQDNNKLTDYHEELRQISATNFRFRENGDPTEFCSIAAELLFDEETPAARILLGSSEMTEYDPVVANSFLHRLRPENCMVTIFNSDLDGTVGEWETEKWYGAKYQVEELSSEQMAAWETPSNFDSRLKLPALNEYIPTDFSLRCDDDDGMEREPVTEDAIKIPPKLLQDTPSLRLWHKMDRFWRVPKSFVKLAILSGSIYNTPRSMTLNRIFQRVLNDDLNSFVYDASMAGIGYRVSCTPSGYRISVRGYSEKLPFLLDTLTTRILSLIGEMKEGDPVLRKKFAKAKEGLLRETKNYRLDPPHEVGSYNSRLMIEENVWYLDNYIDEMEGEDADSDPLTMEECARAAEESLMGRVKCEALCMGNIDEEGARQISNVIDRHFVAPSRTLSEVETPSFRSLKLPTRQEAVKIFGPEVAQRTIPLVYQDLAFSETEENNSVEVILQAGSELELGYEGLALLDLITHIAYNSAYNQLRTKEQLGYIVSAFARKTAGNTWGMSVVVQSSVARPETLEERCEAWLESFRDELEAMSPESIAKEASAVVSQLLESETKLSQEVGRMWGDILNTEGLTDRMRTPAFNRLELLAEQLTTEEEDSSSESRVRRKTALELKELVLSFFDDRLSATSPNRRAMSARVYSHDSRSEFEAARLEPGILSSYADMRHLKRFLSSYPSVPYWRVDSKNPESLRIDGSESSS